jgi:1-acyl-sn-glycerol-3-phosphate acyltransferase
MKKILSWPFSILSSLAFVLSLLIGHVLFLLVMPFGQYLRWRMAYFVNHIINSSLCFSGTTYRAEGRENLNNLEGNIIIVSNHQSMMDIPFIGVVFQKYAPRFIAKRELGRGIPFISLRLRNGGGILIDRGNASQAIKAIEKQAPEIAAQGGAICIFPEGTRAKDGIMKRFKPSGLRVLMKALNNPMIVPVSISNSWKLLMYKMMPLPFGTPVKMVIHPAIHTAGQSAESVIEKVEAIIRARVE